MQHPQQCGFFAFAQEFSRIELGAIEDAEEQPQVIQLPLCLDGLAGQLVKLVDIKWLRLHSRPWHQRSP